MANLRKHFNRGIEKGSQLLGRSEGSDDLTTMADIEQRVTLM